MHWLYMYIPQMYFESWKYMFLRRSLASLARAVLCTFFVGTFGGLAPPPPHTKKLATLMTTHTIPLGAPPPPMHHSRLPLGDEDLFLWTPKKKRKKFQKRIILMWGPFSIPSSPPPPPHTHTHVEEDLCCNCHHPHWQNRSQGPAEGGGGTYYGDIYPWHGSGFHWSLMGRKIALFSPTFDNFGMIVLRRAGSQKFWYFAEF